MRTQLAATMLVCVLATVTATCPAEAQAPTPKFKQGDRVEFSENSACLGAPYAIPSKGTVLQVNAPDGMNYVVQVDPLPGKAPRTVTRPIYSQACGFRALGTAGPVIRSDQLRIDANDTVLADRALLDCADLKHDGRNGSPPPVTLVKTLIRCLYEKPSPDGQDGATTMDITDFRLGGARRWVLYQDMGQGELNTLVYPVHVRWNMKTFYRTRNVAMTDRESAVTCFADKTNLWQCGWAAGPHQDGKTEEIMVRP